MKIKNIKNVTRALFFTFLLLSSALTASAAEVSLDDFIKEAVSSNPGVQQAYLKWQAAEYKVKSVKRLPDPKENYGKGDMG